MTKKIKAISVDKFREFEESLSRDGKVVKYKVIYPDSDKNSPHATLSNGFGYYMVFKSIGWRTEEFLLERISDLAKNDELYRNHGRFEVKIKIIDVKY